jgi:hypothetical protein
MRSACDAVTIGDNECGGTMERPSTPVLIILGGAAAGVILMSFILLSGADKTHSPRIPPESTSQNTSR